MKLLSLRRWLCVLSLGFQSQGGIEVLQNQAVSDFPESITFRLRARGDAEIETVEIEFGTDALKCGQSVERAVPEDLSPGTTVRVEWKWNFRRTGPVPPGTTVWWRWIIKDIDGNVVVTEDRELLFADASVEWRASQDGPLSIHWYSGSSEFGNRLLDVGRRSLRRLEDTIALEPERDIQVFVYESPADMQSASLFAPDWSGGRAFPAHSTVLLAIREWELDWGKRVLAHELAHVVIGHYTFSCMDSTPIWVDEGLAMHAEGEMGTYYADLLSQAIEDDSLLSVRELGETFSDSPELASLAYAQSLSLMQYLVGTYGHERIMQMLDGYRGGLSEDRVLMEVFGFDRDGLEVAWRERIGAPQMVESGAAESTSTPDVYPTFVPIMGPEAMATSTPEISSSLEAVLETPVVTSTLVPDDGDGQTNRWAVVAAAASLELAMLLWLVFVSKRRKHSGDH